MGYSRGRIMYKKNEVDKMTKKEKEEYEDYEEYMYYIGSENSIRSSLDRDTSREHMIF